MLIQWHFYRRISFSHSRRRLHGISHTEGLHHSPQRLVWWPVITLNLNLNLIDNFRALCHDPKEFPEPDLLIPERFLKNGKFNVPGRDPLKLNFGFGRRRVYFRYNFERVLIIPQGMSWKSHWHFNVVHLCRSCIGTFRYWESSRWEGQHNRAKLPVQ